MPLMLSNSRISCTVIALLNTSFLINAHFSSLNPNPGSMMTKQNVFLDRILESQPSVYAYFMTILWTEVYEINTTILPCANHFNGQGWHLTHVPLLKSGFWDTSVTNKNRKLWLCLRWWSCTYVNPLDILSVLNRFL